MAESPGQRYLIREPRRERDSNPRGLCTPKLFKSFAVGRSAIPPCVSLAGVALITVRVIPRAKRDEVRGERNGRLVVRTTAPAQDGKANAAVERLLAAHFHTREVEIVAGHRSRDKTVLVGDVSPDGGEPAVGQAP